MGAKFSHWQASSERIPTDVEDVAQIVRSNRNFVPVDELNYGDHGLNDTIRVVSETLRKGGRIALYADYDVDGTMSAVSWIWFLRGIGYKNFTHYIPCRFKEGYGVNLEAVKHLIDVEKADLIITMDTGITANAEAAYCRERGVEFICTDHHKIQADKMPDCVILNPKQHPEEIYQELCGCGITFVLLRKLAQEFPIAGEIWTDILALAGMATICDVVPLNGVNHRLAKLGVQALMRSRREVLRKLRDAAAMQTKGDEKDIGFRVGPRINAVGRLEHADKIVSAFVEENPDQLIKYMGECNDRRKLIQQDIVEEAMSLAAQYPDDPILFLGGNWHPGVVGIAASKVAEAFWRPTWLFNRDEGLCKGSARSIPGFDVTEAMAACDGAFVKFGGHKAAGGYSFEPEDEDKIREKLIAYGRRQQQDYPDVWRSRVDYDCELPLALGELALADQLQHMKPFGHGFEEPKFRITSEVVKIQFYNDKRTGLPKHTALFVKGAFGEPRKILFFNEVLDSLGPGDEGSFIVTAGRNEFRGSVSLDFYGVDWAKASDLGGDGERDRATT